MASVVGTDGNSYHLWALPDESAPEPECAVSYTTLTNDLSDGYRSSTLFGVNTGVRRWSLTMPTLASLEVLSNTVTDPDGASVSREEYVWSLYAANKTSGTPFVYPDPRTGQYYLVDFEDEELSFQRMKVKIYSSGLTLRQRRLEGVSVFEPGMIAQVWGSFDPQDFPGPFGNAWSGTAPGGFGVTLENYSGGVANASVNGLNVVRFAGTDGVISSTQTVVAQDIFLLMKVREATFSNYSGIVSASASTVALLGDLGTTEFYDLGFGPNYTYQLNNVEYPEASQSAPMNTFGRVRITYPNGWNLSNLQLGADRGNAGRHANMDLAYIVICDSVMPEFMAREVDEFFIIMQNILNS